MTSRIQDLRARYNANGNAVIPNTFQHPNIFIDKLMFYLTAEENVVLTFAVRRILGFQENIISRKDNISLSQFTDGITAKDGSILSLGCGLGVQSVRACLDSLETYKILISTTEKPSPTKGQEYWLQDNESMIDWDGLEKRKMNRAEKYRVQTRKATKISLKSRCYVERKGNVERKDIVTSNVTDGVTLNVNTKPTETHETQPGADAPKSVEWQIGTGQKVITVPDNDTAQRRDAANLIATGLGIHAKAAAELAFAFQDERGMTFTTSEIKGQRKAVKFLLEKKVQPEHVREAVRTLMGKNFTCANLFSITDNAVDLANQKPVPPVPTRVIHRATPTEGINMAEAKRRGLIPG